MPKIPPASLRGTAEPTLVEASAAAGAAPANDHAHLVFGSITVTRDMSVLLPDGTIDPNSRVRVVCEAKPNRAHINRHDRTIYQITLTRSAPDPDAVVEFSALTLGLQDTRHTIGIRSLRSDGGDAVFIDGNDQEQPLNVGQCLEVPPTTLIDVSPGKPDKNPADKSIWFLRFSGANCYVEALALDRAEDGRIIWADGQTVRAYGVGHDNTPPPSEPS